MDDPLIGTKLGKRMVLKYMHTNKKGKNYLCKCECGEEKILPVSKLKRGLQTSCFTCMRKEVKKKRIEAKKAFYERHNIEEPNDNMKKLFKKGE